AVGRLLVAMAPGHPDDVDPALRLFLLRRALAVHPFTMVRVAGALALGALAPAARTWRRPHPHLLRHHPQRFPFGADAQGAERKDAASLTVRGADRAEALQPERISERGARLVDGNDDRGEGGASSRARRAGRLRQLLLQDGWVLKPSVRALTLRIDVERRGDLAVRLTSQALGHGHQTRRAASIPQLRLSKLFDRPAPYILR